MGNLYRTVYCNFWEDVKVQEDFTPEDRYFYIYLLTNPHTTAIGVYQITVRQMAFELGYTPESVKALLFRFKEFHKLVDYDEETRELVIFNWAKHNLNRGGKPFEDLIQKEVKTVLNKKLLLPAFSRTPQEKIKYIIGESLAAEGFVESLPNRDTNRGTNGGTKTKNKKLKTKNKKRESNTSASPSSSTVPYVEIIDYYNEVSGKKVKYETYKEKIVTRWNEGYTLDDFKHVIDVKYQEWVVNTKDPERTNRWFHPDTLFRNKTKFARYVEEELITPPKAEEWDKW